MTLAVRGVSVSFGSLPVLVDVFLTVRRGEVVSLIGPSGCGKSTLLRCIAGLLNPSEGSIDISREEGSRTSVALAFQRPVLLDWLTVAENLALPLRFAGKSLNSEQALELLRPFGLEAFAGYFPHEISVGMAQRVCLARALGEEASLVLLDEPLSGLDEVTRRAVCVDLSRNLFGRSAIFVTHSIHDAVFLGQRVVVLSARPAGIRGEVSVDLPTPRTADLWLDERLSPYIAAVRNKVLG